MARRKKRGFSDVISALLYVIIGMGIAVFVYMTLAILGGKFYAAAEPTIQNINNTQIKDMITSSVTNSFSAYTQFGDQLPVISLVVVAVIIILLLVGVLPRLTATSYYYSGQQGGFLS
jgi:hypothetical protein